MRKIRDVLRLEFESGLSERVVARSMSLSNGSVTPISNAPAWRACSGPCPSISTTVHWSVFCSRWLRRRRRRAHVRARVADVDKEMRREGVTRALVAEKGV
jgi:hypothetical protein